MAKQSIEEKIRYKAIDECIQRGRFHNITIDDIVKHCNKKLYEHDPSTNGVQKRTIYNDIAAMQNKELFGAPIARETRPSDNPKHSANTKFFFYTDPTFSISNPTLSEADISTFQKAYEILSKAEGIPFNQWVDDLKSKLEFIKHPSFEAGTPIVQFDYNYNLKGLEFLSDLLDATQDKKCIKITYQPFQKEQRKVHFSPQLLKEYNNRWFAIGKIKEKKLPIVNIALDRIISIEKSNKLYDEPTIDFVDHFHDLVGVSLPENAQKEQVQIKVNRTLSPYLSTKPIHPSQKPLKPLDHNYDLLCINVVINYELKALLSSYMNQIEVLQPLHLRDYFKQLHKNALEQYSS